MLYRVRALDASGEVRETTLEAFTEAEAAEQAARSGWQVIDITARGAVRHSSKRFALLLFCQELLALLEAGLSIVEAVDTLLEKESRPEAREVLARMHRSLAEGRRFSEALASTGIFPPLFIATVQSAERTGHLSEALSRFLQYQQQLAAVRSQLISALIYPMVLFITGGGITLFLLGYVVPRLSGFYSDLKNLPLTAKLLVETGIYIRDHVWGLVIGGALGLGVLVFLLLQKPVQRFLLAQLWSLKAMREPWRIIILNRFFRANSLLLTGGIQAIRALEMTGDLLHPSQRAGLEGALTRIRAGEPLSVALEAGGLTTPVALRLLRVGEHSGRLGEMMERVARFYEDDIARWLNWLTRLIGPLMMLAMGATIGGIVFLLYMPIFELVGNIK